jgi:hypothetical protein
MKTEVSKMAIFNAALAAIMLVIITMTIRDWIRSLKNAREDLRKQSRRRKFYK